MKRIFLAGLLCIAPALNATPISGFVEFSSFSIGAQYRVVAAGNGSLNQGFVVNATDPLSAANPWVASYQTNFGLQLDPLPVDATLTSATVNLSYLLGSVLNFATTPQAPTTNNGNDYAYPAAGSNYHPAFSAAPSVGVAFSISNGTVTQAVTDILSPVDLLGNFRDDIVAGRDLTVLVTVSDNFNVTRTASNARVSNKWVWKNVTANYDLGRTVQNARFEATGNVDYTTPPPVDDVPEPLTLPLSGAGLMALGFFVKRRK